MSRDDCDAQRALTTAALVILSSTLISSLSKPIENAKFRSIIVASFISLLAASSWPQFIAHVSRVASFQGSLSPAEAEDRASAGWFLGPDGQQICFSCGTAPGHADRHGCQYQELLGILAGREFASAAKPWPAQQVGALHQFLGGRMPGFVESFGFSRSLVALATVREFVLSSGGLPTSPGRLMELTQDLAGSGLAGLADRVNAELLVQLLGAAGTLSGSAPVPLRDEAFSPRSQMSAAQLTDAEAPPAPSQHQSSSEMCVICRSRQKNRVILPCAHFAACDPCLRGCDICPTCHGRILATLVAFIS